jgi:hypothetical protein
MIKQNKEEQAVDPFSCLPLFVLFDKNYELAAKQFRPKAFFLLFLCV